jgi:hydrogenase maturation protease
MPPAMSSRSASDKTPPRILLYGYGNPGRQDDGVGVLLVEELGEWARLNERHSLTLDSNYQLNVEDALSAAEHDVVIFADASRSQLEDFRFQALRPSATVSSFTHSMSPERVIALSRDLYGARPAAFLLTVRGYEWEPNGPLTSGARRNLEAAKAYIMPFLESPLAGPPAPVPDQ